MRRGASSEQLRAQHDAPPLSFIRGSQGLPVSVRHAHVPNASLSFRELAVALLRPMSIEEAEVEAARLFPDHHAVAFASCRGTLAAATAVLAPSGKVGIAGYTCTAVPNGVISGGGSPIYVDVDGTGLVPTSAWPAADALIVQDTYGFRSPVPTGRTVIRDAALCADGFGCDEGVTVSVTSFEHSKALSAGQGGLALTRVGDVADGCGAGAIRHPATGAVPPTQCSPWSSCSAAACSIEATRSAAWGGGCSEQWPQLRGGPDRQRAARRGVDPMLLGRPSRCAARLMILQLTRAPALAAHRSHIVGIYNDRAGVGGQALPLSRYPMTVSDTSAFASAMRSAGWALGSPWFNAPLHPARALPQDFGYRVSADSGASRLAETVVNLPTHPLVSAGDADELIGIALAVGASHSSRASTTADPAST